MAAGEREQLADAVRPQPLGDQLPAVELSASLSVHRYGTLTMLLNRAGLVPARRRARRAFPRPAAPHDPRPIPLGKLKTRSRRPRGWPQRPERAAPRRQKTRDP